MSKSQYTGNQKCSSYGFTKTNTTFIDIFNEGVIPMLAKIYSFESISSTSYEEYGASLLRTSPTSRIFDDYWREKKQK